MAEMDAPDGRIRYLKPVLELSETPPFFEKAPGTPRLPSRFMDFQLTAEQAQFRDSVLAFSRKHLADGARERAHKA